MAISGNIPNVEGYLLYDRRLSVGGIMVSIAAFQAVDPGSIPGRRSFGFFLLEPFKSNFDFEGKRTLATQGMPVLHISRPYKLTLSKVA